MKMKSKLINWTKRIVILLLAITVALIFVPSQGQVLSRSDSKISLIRLETQKMFLIPFKFPKITKKEIRYVFPSGTPIVINSTFGSDTDSMLGTVTFVDTKSQLFSAFGHGIDTELIDSVVKQQILKVEEVNIIDEESEKEFKLKGLVPKKSLMDNSSKIFHQSSNCILGKAIGRTLTPTSAYPIPAAFKEEIATEEYAYIISNVSNKVTSYKIKVDSLSWEENKINFTVIDPDLILKGGIMKGMSGSPIIQNGKLIGAISKVNLSDTKKGEAITAEVLIEESLEY